jgi:predicted porin
MNNTIKLAVAGAVLSAASIANAGIIIPAGEWTMDINGNVNVYATFSDFDDAAAAAGGLSGAQANGESNSQGINTGLLPAWLGFTGTTRQNDLDVSFTISLQPNVSSNTTSGDSDALDKGPLWRQAFLTFGDKSWGTVKMGKDIGVFAQQAILNDMTLLGVGAGAAATSGASTSLGGIGTGYIYPAWKGQIAYTTPNMNGLQATVAITNPNQHVDAAVSATYQDRFGLEAQVTYDMPMGKLWVSGASYEFDDGTVSYDATVMDVGTTLNFGNASVTGYYYSGEGVGSTMMGGFLGTSVGGVDSGSSALGVERDSDGGYIQATYVIPAGTKLGVAYGTSRLDTAGADAANAAILDENNRWTVGAYHPLTKHLNLVAEYNDVESKDHAGVTSESSHISLGAILFF